MKLQHHFPFRLVTCLSGQVLRLPLGLLQDLLGEREKEDRERETETEMERVWVKLVSNVYCYFSTDQIPQCKKTYD